MQSALTVPNDSHSARPGRFTSILVLLTWTVAVLAEVGTFAYSLPVTRYRALAGMAPSPQSEPVMIAITFVMASLGSLIVLRATSRRYGWLMLGTGFSLAVISFTMEYSQYALLVVPQADLPLSALAAWVQDLWMIPMVQVTLLLPMLFPDGKLPSPRWRAIFWPTLAGWSLLVLVFAFGQRPLTNAFDGYATRPRNPVGVIPGSMLQYQIVWVVLFTVTTVTAMAGLIYRWRVAGGEVRQQIKWVLYAFLLMLLTQVALLIFGSALTDWAGIDLGLEEMLEVVMRLSLLGLVTALGIAVLRYRLYDIDLIINRTLVYGLLTVIVTGGYVLIVTALGAVVPSEGILLPSLVATGIIAALFAPLRELVQRGVNRLMFGERDEPYAVLSRLGRRLEGTLAPGAVLPTIVETVAQTLKLPYVAVALKAGGDFQVAASIGNPVEKPHVVPLNYQGQVIGRLICGPRSGGDPFRAEERRLLQDVARQAGVALQAVQSNAELQRSRERLVITREEERRRIRRDLHDGLGPALASQTLKLGSARALLKRDPEAAERLLAQLEGDVNEALKDIRRLVYNLRPPALDELGLLRAIQQDATRHPGLNVSFALPPTLPELSAAVEVAVYRIVQEALANVVRHAGASKALVRVEADDALRLTVADDGEGLPADVRSGVGLRSMRERAEELGGTFRVVSAPGGGTTIEVRLPLRGKEA